MNSESSNTNDIEIIGFHSRHTHDFRDLNYEWLEEYFTIEPYDRIVLENPQKQIIDHGGRILFAISDSQVVGTCALLKQTELKYELAKMGVSKLYRNRGIGHKLLAAAIESAKELKAKTLVLATSKVLESANHLYKDFGFRECNLDLIGPLPYKRETIAMILKLK